MSLLSSQQGPCRIAALQLAPLHCLQLLLNFVQAQLHGCQHCILLQRGILQTLHVQSMLMLAGVLIELQAPAPGLVSPPVCCMAVIEPHQQLLL